MLEIYAANIYENINESVRKYARELIGDDKKARMKKYVNGDDAARLLVGDLLVRSVISKKCNIDNLEIKFSENAYGKPYLTGSTGLKFNISHSGAWVVCSIGEEENGVDIEKMRPVNLGISKRFFSNEEYQEILNKKEEERLYEFYKIWTLKESYIKAIGTGLSTALNTFTISESGTIYSVNVSGKCLDYSLRTYTFDSDYLISVCTKEKEICEGIMTRCLNDIIDDLIST